MIEIISVHSFCSLVTRTSVSFISLKPVEFVLNLQAITFYVAVHYYRMKMGITGAFSDPSTLRLI